MCMNVSDLLAMTSACIRTSGPDEIAAEVVVMVVHVKAATVKQNKEMKRMARE